MTNLCSPIREKRNSHQNLVFIFFLLSSSPLMWLLYLTINALQIWENYNEKHKDMHDSCFLMRDTCFTSAFLHWLLMLWSLFFLFLVTLVKNNKIEKLLDYLAFVDFFENNFAVNLNEERFGLAILAMHVCLYFSTVR